MGSRERDAKSLQDKLKVFFNKKAAAPSRGWLAVSAELARELGPSTPSPRRLRAVKDLTERALTARLPDGGVERVWAAVRDLLDDPSASSRHSALALLRALAEGQGERLGAMRTVLLQHLRDSHPPRAEDAAPRFRLLHALTDSGKNISCLEEQIGPFLVDWLPLGQPPALLVELLQLVTNVVKFNASSLDEEIVHGIVDRACHLCVYSADAGVVQACLALLEAVVSYSLLPRAALPAFVGALCRTVNIEQYTQNGWKLMRYVVGGDIGHAALHEMVEILRASGDAAEPDAGLVRGAVFYINMALWGPQRVPALRVSFLAVLPAMLQAVRAQRAVVTYEVLVALQSLVAREPHELHAPAWDALLAVLRAAHRHDQSLEPANELIHSRLHALITGVEQLHMAGQFGGDVEALLELVDECSGGRPEASVMWLVTARASQLAPSGRDWVAAALALAERYLRHEPRLPVRLHTLAALVAFIARHRFVYGEELVERVGVPVLGACALDAEPAVRAAAARALTELARATSSDATTDLIDLLEKILNRPFEMFVSDVAVPLEGEAGALRLAAGGLLELLQCKLLRSPPQHAARCFLVLLDHLDHHYRRPALFQHHPDIRIKIFEMIFGLRANAFNCVGFCSDGVAASGGAPSGGATGATGVAGGTTGGRARLVCSPYLMVEPPSARGSACPPVVPPPGAVLLPAGRAARALGAALAREADWAVLGRVLRALPHLLQARALAVGRRAQDLDVLAATLCAMVSDRSLSFPECVRVPAGQKLTVSEFHGTVLPALAALAPYHSFLEPQTQQRIVRCLLKYGMVLRTPQPYINALTIFTLETRDTMVKMLPEVLLDLSKISDTQLIASPMLEFLSTLTRLPRVFASFVEDQYMSVFAILLPYTNPSRYNHYVVSLAHHVIAAWFLKCRLSYRRNFVRFIIHGLHNYIIMPFEEQLQNRAGFQPPTANEDSSNRQRSSSLGSRAVSRAPLGGRGAAGGASASAAFHVELTETCVDLLSRYAFTPCSVKPQRSDTAEFLFGGGQAATWLVGHKLVTITTTGCQQNSVKQGPCDRCQSLCRQHAESVGSALPPLGAAADDAPQGEVKRQNSGESARGGDPLAEALASFTQRFEKISKEVDGEEVGWSRVGDLSAAGACPCWCAHWAEVHVRSPTGDVAWAMRMQNHMSWDHLLESPLQDVAALLAGASPLDRGAEGARTRRGPDEEPPPAAPAADAPPEEPPSAEPPLSDAELGPSRAATQPINIPGSPQRQSSSSTTDDDDMLLIVPSGKSRHPVRRSNSSPEMSSSWKPPREPLPEPPAEPPIDPDEMIVLPGVEPTSASMSLHQTKKAAKKSDMRVSCEAIPEEMSGTSPLAPAAPAPHPQLLTLRSDPGAVDGAAGGAGGGGARLALQKTASDSTVGAGELPPLARSKRSNTISVMSPTRRREQPRVAGGGGNSGAGSGGGGVTPAFVFLQLYHNMSTYPMTPPVPGEAPPMLHPLAERPLRVSGAQHERTIKNLDLVPPVETYKVGVLYVGPGQQDDEVQILRNEYGSVRYAEFLRQLGTLVPLDGAAAPPDLFLNLETGGKDGHYTYVWSDDVMQVLFHVATAMPSSPRDPTCNEKRKYIGNDYVSIVYNDSGADFNIHTIKGQLNFCIVVVEPFEHGMNRVLIKTKDERIRTKFLAHVDTHCVSDPNVALLARQVALHCALASQISQSLKLGGAPYASNSLERLRVIKRLRRRAEAERLAQAARAPAPYAGPRDLQQRVAIDDFNDYT